MPTFNRIDSRTDERRAAERLAPPDAHPTRRGAISMASSLIRLHEKSKSYDWDFTFAAQSPKYETKYKMPKKGKDPFRLLIRDYMKMEAEKDDRTHGFIDGAIRTREATGIEPRFVECMKLTLPDLTNAEFQAVAGCGMIISAVENQELRQGYAAQML